MEKYSIRHIYILSICLWFSLSSLFEVNADPVNIPDPGLRSAFELMLGKKPGDSITKAEMGAASFKIFSAKERNVSDLTGIEYATSLKYLYLESNSISDISPLSHLTGLEHIHLEHNQITDISPLSTLTGLQSLNISYNKLTSLDGLPDLSLVYGLFVQHNQITNIKPLIDDIEFTSLDDPDTINLNLEGNPLDDDSVDVYLPILIFDRYITVKFTTTYVHKVSGDNQTAKPSTTLQPFVIEVVNFRNEKLSGVDVTFGLISGSGTFVDGTKRYGYQVVDTTTDTDGKAYGTLTTGSTTGVYRIFVHVTIRHPMYIAQTGTSPFTVTVIDSIVSPLILEQKSQHLPEYLNPEVQPEETPQQEVETSQTQQQEELPQQEGETTQTQQQEELPQQDVETPLELEPNYTKMPFDYEKEWVGKVVFSELMLSQNNQCPQWIELYNTTDQDIDLYGWKIVGRYLDESKTVSITLPQVVLNSFVIKGKETVLLVSFAALNLKDRMSDGLADKTYALNLDYNNLWNYRGLVLELQDADGNPIDRTGNLNAEDEIAWEIPQVVRNNRISFIRRLKTLRSHEYNFSLGIKKFGWFSADKVQHLIGEKVQHYYGSSSDIGTPGYRTESGKLLPVVLSSFRSDINEEGEIILSWITESEIDNAGFNILRSQSKQGPFVKVNLKLIQGAGTTGKRSSYRWTDTTAKPKVEYYYRIEDVSFAGDRQTLSTIRLKGLISANNRFITQWGDLKSRH